ncbi:MAG: DnaA regulatory inactivator Hda [Dokdonella sp.]
MALRWPAHQRFESFVAGPNVAGVNILCNASNTGEPSSVFLAGPTGSGKTHLLIAACAQASAQSRSAQYMDLAAFAAQRSESIRRFGGSELLAIDNVQQIAGEHDAEHALFDLHNRCRADGAILVFAANDQAGALGLELPDLVSRLSACTQIVLRPLDEATRRQIVRDLASVRGLEFDDAVLDWLFTRKVRDMGSLVAQLDRIDRATLAAQRRVTVPFLRSLSD